MKTKLRLLSIFYFISITNALMAQSVDINTAKTIAEHHLSTIVRQSLKSANNKGTSFQFTSIKVEVENKDTLYYLLNDTINSSFVIVSADKRVRPILGFSTEGSFDENKQPDAFTAWMNVKKKEIEFIIKNNVQPDQTIIKSWENLSLKNGYIETSGVGPLLKTKWGQSCYYNASCPSSILSCAPCGHCLTGCTATAMAQLMKYWNYPAKGKGSNTYIDYNNGNISADFGSTTYQWAQMSDSLTNSNNEVATLMYHCGVAIGTSYGASGSAGNSSVDPYINYFDYSSNARKIFRINYTSSQWNNILKQELDLSRPIILDTEFSRVVGHSFVCDGYKDNDFFHFNWGWDGAANGYYLISANFSQFNLDSIYAAIIGLVPNHLPNEYKGVFINLNKINLSINNTKTVTINSSSNWKAKTDQSWVSLNTSQGNAGTSTLNITALDNEINNNRVATLTIEAEGFPDQLITVTQNKRFTVTPGGLKDALDSDLTTITDLVIVGKIDARDFKTMRDSMPFLEDIDLSKTSIVSYNGTEGTSMYGNTYYEANAIPESAFQKGWGHISMALKSIKLPTAITKIRNYAFIGCQYLESVNIPSFVTRIDAESFMGTNIQTLNIPSSVENCWLAFRGCRHLATITVEPTSSNYTGLDGILFNKSKTELFLCPMTVSGNYYIPPTVNVIKDFAFESCEKITYLNLPISVRSIGYATFQECRGLTSLSLPSSITSIGAHAFHNCINLNSITANWLTPIDLKKVEEVFYNVDKSTCKLYVPYGTASLYAAANQWKDFKNIVEMPNQSPIANTGTDLSINEGTTVTLDASASVDSDGQAITYLWTAPVGIALSSSTAVKPTFMAPEVKKDSTIIFSLIVNDGILNSVPSTVKVNVLNVIKVGISEITAQTLKVYPNPVTNELILENEGNTNKTEFEIMNSVGQTVTLGIVHDKTVVQTDHFTHGIYLIKLKSGETIEFRKIIKK